MACDLSFACDWSRYINAITFNKCTVQLLSRFPRTWSHEITHLSRYVCDQLWNYTRNINAIINTVENIGVSDFIQKSYAILWAKNKSLEYGNEVWNIHWSIEHVYDSTKRIIIEINSSSIINYVTRDVFWLRETQSTLMLFFTGFMSDLHNF